ncbi:MAG: hypothetical protein FJ145_00665 [Deltaproteobacteria bacterium]|nr:hypothetical protein [Deltaproteobacteria bacterium]
MRKQVFSWIVASCLVCLIASSAQATLQDDIDQAVTIIQRFQEIPEQAIPRAVLREAKGLAILTVTKAGFIGSVRGGTGLVIARAEKGWSAPSAIGTGGIGFGFQAGAQVTEFVLVLNTHEAVKAFSYDSNVTLGGNLSAAAGPVGRSAEAGLTINAAVYTYSRSQGLFAGLSLEGTVIGTRNDANEQYYGKRVFARDILAGDVKPTAGAQKLIQALGKY